VLRLVAQADNISENFNAGVMASPGFGWEAMAWLNPRRIRVSHKGLSPGACEHRTAIDEEAQMLRGPATMTGRGQQV
jgi:crotonobetainyl-CoA:carnitine CoA-transferase CaiB-like acyl-CoA transferase